MRNVRAAWVTIVLGATVAGALWLYFYREIAVVEYVGYTYAAWASGAERGETTDTAPGSRGYDAPSA